ncbi:hypothetical protein [Bacteroides sp. UBA939]|uniref:hypothetical protein n=1 Tax=Bacteroides sp. UBA939 TaxID=1946092 RepID=UPI0025C706D6|nr:hypothetical protein [Bacteroides sp. UBA939]
MTTLFAIMLVLFAVSFSRFKIKEGELTDKNNQLEILLKDYQSIISIYSTVGSIDNTKYFGYNNIYLKHMFQINVEYQTQQYDINTKLKLDIGNKPAADTIRKQIVEAGQLVQQKIQELNRTIPETKDSNIKFLVIVEGQSSKVPFNQDAWKNNYTLSFLRAQYLNEFWKQNNIDFTSIPRCELLISGSGEAGVPREVPNEKELKEKHPVYSDYIRQWNLIEEKNQRFLINIVPVLGNIDNIKAKLDELSAEQN